MVEKQRTIAFAVPESLFQKIKAYLQRNNLTQKQFFLSLIEAELEREEQMLTTAEPEEAGLEDEDPETLDEPEAPAEEAVSGPVSASAENMEEVYQEGAESAEFEPVAADLEEETDHTGEDDALDEDEDESETEDPSFSMGM